jgi:CubicO group peptidase (beta-lactamase class C family)
MDGAVSGHCDPQFGRVAKALRASFARGEETGAAVCVYSGDRLVADLWGGLADPRSGRPWQQDTPCLAYSCAKAVTAVAALRLAEAAGCDLFGPVTEWWPEFGAAGKAATTTAQLLSHQAGLPAFTSPVTVAQAGDPAALAARLAAQAPEWAPGTAHGYHALTYGWLAGELVRRLSGGTVGAYLAGQIAGPLGLGLWLGGPAPVIERAARITRGPGASEARGTGRGSPDSGAHSTGDGISDRARRAFGNPDMTSVPGGGNSAAVLLGGWPASGLLATAAGLAGLYRALLAGQLLAPSTLRRALTPRASGLDRILGVPSAFGMGFMLPSEAFWVPRPGRATAFGHAGLSGAIGLGDPARGLAVGYVTGRMAGGVAGPARAARLLSAVYASAN